MKLEEAIEEQKLYLQHSDQWNHEKLDTAINLGIEALDRIRYGRMHPETTITDLLLGETKEMPRCDYGS